jgi:hypothetical protein
MQTATASKTLKAPTVKATPAKPRRKPTPTAAQLEAREVKRIERLRRSFERVTKRAKKDILLAIKKGKPHYEVESRVFKREACYQDLYSRLKALQGNERTAEVILPVWNAFTEWATGEKLDIKLQPCGLGVNTPEARWYVSIRAQPLRVREVRPPRQSRQGFGRPAATLL